MAETFNYTREWTDEKAFPLLGFSRDWNNPDDYHTVELEERKVRADMQSLHDEVKNYLNNQLIPAVIAEEATVEDWAHAEAERVSAETARADAEDARSLAEVGRTEAEQTRVAAEETRVAAEQARVTAEQERADAATGYVAQAKDYSETANASAASAAASANEANTSAGNALLWGDLAEKSARTAKGSAATASSQAADARGFKNDAETAANRANASENEAKRYSQTALDASVAADEAATAASNSEKNAKTYENNAKTYENNAKRYYELTRDTYVDVEVAAGTATGQASNAANYANKAQAAQAAAEKARDEAVAAGGVFVAEYGVTTADELYEQLSAGRMVTLRVPDSGGIFAAVQSGIINSDAYYFDDLVNNVRYICAKDSGGDTSWSTETDVFLTEQALNKHNKDTAAHADIREAIAAGGSKPTTNKLCLTPGRWSGNSQVVVVSGILGDENAQMITVSPEPDSMAVAAAAGVFCSGQAENRLTFKCATTPTDTVWMQVAWQSVEYVGQEYIRFTYYYSPMRAIRGQTWMEYMTSNAFTLGGDTYTLTGETFVDDASGYYLADSNYNVVRPTDVIVENMDYMATY